MNYKVILFFTLVTVFISCKKEIRNPVIKTAKVSPISAGAFYVKAEIIEKGSYPVLEYGFVYSNSDLFDIQSGTKLMLGTDPAAVDTFSATLPFSNSLYGPHPTYYIKAYLTNKNGTVYGDILSATPLTLTMGAVSPTYGRDGDTITITGQNFSPDLSGNIVKFNTVVAKVISASSTKLKVIIPEGIIIGNTSFVTISVTVGAQIEESQRFTLLPIINDFSPKLGSFDQTIIFSGKHLDAYGIKVKFNDVESYVSYKTDNMLITGIPPSMKSLTVKIKVVLNDIETEVPGVFTLDHLVINSLSPARGLVGTSVYLVGKGFNASYSTNNVKIGNVFTSSSRNSTMDMDFIIPESLGAGTYSIEIGNGIETQVLPNAFTVLEPKISSFDASGYIGSEVTVQGENFRDNPVVYFGYTSPGEVVSSDTSHITVKVPKLMPGNTNLRIQIGKKTYTLSNDFIILPTVIDGFSPTSGKPGTIVTVKGKGFSNSCFTDYPYVFFGDSRATVLSLTSTEIKLSVPSEPANGPIKIIVNTCGVPVVSSSDFTIFR